MENTYTVKPGDTLWGISNQYGVSVTELARINNVTADKLRVGQVLTIPIKSGTNPSNMFMYTVKKGDSLYSIAKKYYTTVNDIIDINNLTNLTLKIGQVLRIPEKYTEGELTMPDFTNYIVKKGDSLYSISKKFNTTVEQIKKDNALVSNTLNIGQVLKIRNTFNELIIEECFGEEYIPTTTYKVVKGDTLYSISKKFNTTVDNIKAKNNLSSNTLNIGMILKI